MSICLEGLTPANIAFLQVHRQAIQGGTGALQGPIGDALIGEIDLALIGHKAVTAVARDLVDVHRGLHLAQVGDELTGRVVMDKIPWREIEQRQDGLGGLAAQVRDCGTFKNSPIWRLAAINAESMGDRLKGERIVYFNLNRVVSSLLNVTGLYQETEGGVMAWDFSPEFLLLGMECVFGSEAVHAQLTTERSTPREVRDMLAYQDALPLWLWPGEGQETRDLHEHRLKSWGIYQHELFHLWLASRMGRDKRQECVAVYDCLEEVLGGEITFAASPAILAATDIIMSGMDMDQSERVQYKFYLESIYKGLNDPEMILDLHDRIGSRFFRHPHMFMESGQAAQPYRRQRSSA